MLSKFRRFLLPDVLDIRTYFLAFFWLSGLLLGILFASLGYQNSLALAYAAASPSLFKLVAFRGVPILLTWLLASYFNSRWIYALSFAELFIFGYSVSVVMIFFGSAGWLVSGLLMFSAGGMLIPLFWAAVRLLSGEKLQYRDWLCCFGIVLGCTLIDYLLMSPFLVSLIECL